MKLQRELYTSSMVIVFLLVINITNSFAQLSTEKKVFFSLASSFGDSEKYEFKVTSPGEIRIQASWRGTVKKLALILNGPGQRGFYARQDGESPLIINFKVTKDHLEKGTNWKVSIVNFSNRGLARGRINLGYPRKLNIRSLEDLEITKDQPSTADNSSSRDDNDPSGIPESSQEPGIHRKILENGDVELRYPDGTIKIISDGGITIINPDGTESRFLQINKPPTYPPELPADQRISSYLNWQIESLLDLIKKILNQNEESVQNYLNHESEIAPGIYEKMYIRTRYIDRLLSN